MNKKNFIFLSMAMVLVLSLYFVIATAIADNITFTDVSGTPDEPMLLLLLIMMESS